MLVGVHMRSGMVENARDVALLFSHDRDYVLSAIQACTPHAIQRELAADVPTNSGSGGGGGGGDVVPRDKRSVVVFLAADNAKLKRRAKRKLQRLDSVRRVVTFDGAGGGGPRTNPAADDPLRRPFFFPQIDTQN